MSGVFVWRDDRRAPSPKSRHVYNDNTSLGPTLNNDKASLDHVTDAYHIEVIIDIGWRDVTVIYGHDTISLLYGMMSHSSKLTGQDLLRYLTKLSSVFPK